MILNKINENQEITPVSFEFQKLKQWFPQYFDKQGNFNFEEFEQALKQNEVNFTKESYGLNFLGKQYARLQTGLKSETVITPDLEHNEQEQNKNSENIYIKGDNLDALRHMLHSYLGKIKCIYIDPPYNTGSDDFVYPDKFEYSKKDLVEKIGLDEEEAERIYNLAGKATHSAWLTFMLPRLTLARDLLSDDGVIFISIDDNEQSNLKLLCDDIFGEENCIGCAGRITKKSNNKGDFWAPNFDYLLTYAKNKITTLVFSGGAKIDAYKLVEDDGPRKGEKYQLVRLYMSSLANENPEQRFWIKCPDGTSVIPPGKTFPPQRPILGDGIWRWTRETFEAERDKIVIQERRSSNLLSDTEKPTKWNVYVKTYLNDVLDNALAKPNSFIEGHINQKGSHELRELDIPFSYSKPSSLIKYLLEVMRIKEDSFILDFFSGSATTAHAVMQLNAKDGGKRKYIMVQIEEAIKEKDEAYKEGYKTICGIGIERIKRSAEKIKQATGADIDYGFKIYTLNRLGEKTLDKCMSFAEAKQARLQDNYIDLFAFSGVTGVDTILQTWKVQDGYGFTGKHEVVDIEDYSAYLCENTLYLIHPNVKSGHLKHLCEKLTTDYKQVTRLVVYGYSFSKEALHELENNIKQLEYTVNIIKRF